MPRNLIFSAEEAKFLRELKKNGVEFMIVGLSAAALQGAPVVTQDIDLWFKELPSPGIEKALRKVGGSYVPPTAMTPPLFVGKHVALFDIVMNMNGLESFSREKKRALRIPIGSVMIDVLSLERIIASKEAAGREKDKLVLPVLKDALVAIREYRKRGG